MKRQSMVFIAVTIHGKDKEHKGISIPKYYQVFQILRAHDCEYRELLARLKKSKILIICLENPFREIHSKKIFQSMKNQMFPRKWGKTKIRVFT